MRYQAIEFELGPDTLARISEDLFRRWQETVDDAQATATKATAIANPLDAWSLQMEFGMRNAQRWFAWAETVPISLAGDPAEEPAPLNVEPVEVAPAPAAMEEPTAPAAEAPQPLAVEPEEDDEPAADVEAVEDTTPAADVEAVEDTAPAADVAATTEPTTPTADVPQPLAVEPEDDDGPGADVEAVEDTAPATDVAATAEPIADDLKRIRGIGPAIAAKLASLGLSSFAQIAALDTAAIAELDTDLDLKGRIERDDWVGQAEALASTP